MIKFGNWSVTVAGIEWNGSVGEYFIPKDRLNEAGSDSRSNMYDFLVHLAEKTWITKSDLFLLNAAYVFALGHFGIGYSSNLSLSETLIEQQRQFNSRN